MFFLYRDTPNNAVRIMIDLSIYFLSEIKSMAKT